MWVDRLSPETLGTSVPSGREAPPDLVLLFSPTALLRHGELPARLAARYPTAIHLGCSTGTVVTGHTLSNDDPVALAIGFERTPLRLATTSIPTRDASFAAGLRVGAQLAAPDLAGIFLLAPALSVNGDAIVKGVSQAVGPDVSVAGGLAADGDRFNETLVAVGGVSAPDLVAAVGFYGPSIRIAHGIGGGWDEFGPVRHISQASGKVLLSFDDKPALDLYERYLGEDAAGLPLTGLRYPLKIWNPANPSQDMIRTLFSVDREARALTLSDNVPQDWYARLLRGDFERLADAVAVAAEQAADGMARHGLRAELGLIVSSAGRRLLMGQHTDEEINGAAEALGRDLPLAGFYAYGQIGPHAHTGGCVVHNQTAFITLLAEAR